jgi:hypothetical protein
VIISLLAAAGLVGTVCANRDAMGEEMLRVGAGDDVTGLLMEELVKLDEGGSVEFHLMMDCCGSAAQWAITSGDLDAGFYCSDIALTLINLDSDLEIYGPAVLNAEVAALTCDRAAASTIAIPMKREFLCDAVYASFPAVTNISQVAVTSLHYALAGGNVDGIVVDIAKALKAPDFDYVPLVGADYVSYCLVVNKNILGTPQFDEFVSAYDIVARKFNDIEFLKERFEMDDSFWHSVDTKFLYLD